MRISEYRAHHALTREEFGRLIDVSGEFIRLCELGKRRFSPDKAIQLEELTNGEIGRADVRPDLWTPEAQGAT